MVGRSADMIGHILGSQPFLGIVEHVQIIEFGFDVKPELDLIQIVLVGIGNHWAPLTSVHTPTVGQCS